MNKPHVVWDWNGTLLIDNQITISAVIHAIHVHTGRAITHRDHQIHFRRPIRVFFETLAGRRLSNHEFDQITNTFTRRCRELTPALPLHPDAAAALAQIRADGFAQSLLSMHPHDELTVAVAHLGLRRYFSLVQGWRGGSDTKADHLRAHLTTLGRLSNPSSVVVIGDTIDDYAAAEVNGCRFIAVGDPESSLHDHTRFAERGVSVVFGLNEAVESVRKSLHVNS